MIRIASLDDPRLDEYRLLADPRALGERGLFVAEGRLVVRRLLSHSRFVTRSVLVTDAAARALGDVLDRASSPIFVVDQRLMNAVAGFNIHRGCLALAERPPAGTLTGLALDTLSRLVVLEGVNNPDNVGGIFRSAAAFGVDAVILGPACGDPLYRKAVRTSMAATLAVPFVEAGEWPRAIHVLREHGIRVLALTPAPDAQALVPQVPGQGRTGNRIALLVGAEGPGLSEAALTAADARVRIPMHDAADSLNVTVAASLALYALAQ